MPFVIRSAFALCLAALPLFASAAPPYVKVEERLSADQRHATGLDTLSAEQLELLNTLLRDDGAKTAKAEPAPGPPITNEPPPRLGGYIGLDDQPVVSRLKGTINGWAPGTVFELENGQKWKVLKGEISLRKPITDGEIQITPGVAGRWFLHVDDNTPGARVYRIE